MYLSMEEERQAASTSTDRWQALIILLSGCFSTTDKEMRKATRFLCRYKAWIILGLLISPTQLHAAAFPPQLQFKTHERKN